jgi:hypothetical protein
MLEEVAALYLYSGHDGGQACWRGLHEPGITFMERDAFLDPSQKNRSARGSISEDSRPVVREPGIFAGANGVSRFVRAR